MNNKFLVAPLGLLVITVLSGAFLMSSNTLAEDTVDKVNISVPVSCSLSGTGMNSHNATIPNGTYQDSIGTTTLKAFCNDNNGFAIYANGYTGDTLGNNKLIGSSTSSEIVTGTATTAGSPDVSNWAMKLETNSSATYALTLDNGFGSYSSVPSSYTKVAHRDSGTDLGTSAEGATLTSTYAAYISKTQPADSYQGQVIYSLVHPSGAAAPVSPLTNDDCPKNSICYAPNNNEIIGSMDSISSTKVTNSPIAGIQSVSPNAKATLIAPNYSREGYGFAGWSTDFEANPSSIIYGPNEGVIIKTDGTGDADVSTNGLILYPVWVKSVGTIQGWTDCASLTASPTATRASLSSITALTDSRDGNVYSVARLADGKCWIIENLRLDAENSSSVSLAQGFGDDTANNRGKFVGLANSENDGFTINTSSIFNSIYYSNSQSGTATIDIGTANYPAYRIPRYNNNNTNKNLSSSHNGTGGYTYYHWHSYGNYYNWPASTASTTYNGINNQSAINTSLCPRGWRLPRGGNKNRIESNNDNDFWTLIVTHLNNGTVPANYNNSTYPYYDGGTEGSPASSLVRKYPNNFIYAGYFSTSTAYSRNTTGYYWSSTSGGYSDSYYLFLNSSQVYPGASRSMKSNGISIRCIVEP